MTGATGPTIRARGGRRGMTVVELCVGLLITSIVMGALAGLWTAVAHTWRSTDAAQAVTMTGLMASARLEAAVRHSKYVCQYEAGSVDGTASKPAAVLLWRSDDWVGAADGAPQLGELMLIEHDPATDALYAYAPRPYAAMDSGMRTRAAGVPTWVSLQDPGTRALFKGYDFVRKQPLAEAVSGALFNVPPRGAGARPALEATLTVTRGSERTVVYGLAAIRGPSTQPAY